MKQFLALVISFVLMSANAYADLIGSAMKTDRSRGAACSEATKSAEWIAEANRTKEDPASNRNIKVTIGDCQCTENKDPHVMPSARFECIVKWSLAVH